MSSHSDGVYLVDFNDGHRPVADIDERRLWCRQFGKMGICNAPLDDQSMMSEFTNSPLFNWAGQQFLGSCPDLSRFTSRVCSVPGLSDWKPKHDGLLTLVRVLGLGMILGRIDDPSFYPLLNSVADTLKEQDRPNSDDEAELVAAAILRPWCDCVTYVQKSNLQRSPDLVAIVGKYTVEIEVTTGQRKDEQDKRVQIASGLEAKLCALPLKKHIFVHFLDSLNEPSFELPPSLVLVKSLK